MFNLQQFIEWLIYTEEGDRAMNPGFDSVYYDIPGYITGYDACGVALMGGEL